MAIRVGADPELFVKIGKSYQGASGLVRGTKKDPFPVENGAVQVDGMALEINIDPAEDKESFVHNITSVLSSLKDMIPKEYDISESASAKFTRECMDDQPEEAVEIGCVEDWNSYTKRVQGPPTMPNNTRFAGGHVHVGWTEEEDPEENVHLDSCYEMSSQLDVYLALPAMFLDEDRQRRKVYGNAGRFRPKHYGFEYRTLSNFWIFNPKLIGFVYDQVIRGFNKLVKNNTNMARRIGYDYIVDIINNNMLYESFGLIQRYAIVEDEYIFDIIKTKYSELKESAPSSGKSQKYILNLEPPRGGGGWAIQPQIAQDQEIIQWNVEPEGAANE